MGVDYSWAERGLEGTDEIGQHSCCRLRRTQKQVRLFFRLWLTVCRHHWKTFDRKAVRNMILHVPYLLTILRAVSYLQRLIVRFWHGQAYHRNMTLQWVAWLPDALFNFRILADKLSGTRVGGARVYCRYSGECFKSKAFMWSLGAALHTAVSWYADTKARHISTVALRTDAWSGYHWTAYACEAKYPTTGCPETDSDAVTSGLGSGTRNANLLIYRLSGESVNRSLMKAFQRPRATILNCSSPVKCNGLSNPQNPDHRLEENLRRKADANVGASDL